MASSLGIETTPRPRMSDATGIPVAPCPRAPDDGQGDPSVIHRLRNTSRLCQKERMVVFKSSEVWETSAYFFSSLPTSGRQQRAETSQIMPDDEGSSMMGPETSTPGWGSRQRHALLRAPFRACVCVCEHKETGKGLTPSRQRERKVGPPTRRVGEQG